MPIQFLYVLFWFMQMYLKPEFRTKALAEINLNVKIHLMRRNGFTHETKSAEMDGKGRSAAIHRRW